MQKRSNLITNGIMAFLGVTFATFAALSLFLNQQPANATPNSVSKDDSYALYAAAFSKGYTASAIAAAPKTNVVNSGTGCSEGAPTTDEGDDSQSAYKSAGHGMSKQEWATTVNNAYNSYATSNVSYVKNVDSNNTTTTNNVSSNTVTVTDSAGAAVSTNSATNSEVKSNTEVKNEDSNNTKTTTISGSFNSDSHDTKTTNTTTNVNTNVTNTVAWNSYNDETVQHDEPNHDNPPHHNKD